jgi:hypothetical protein
MQGTTLPRTPIASLVHPTFPRNVFFYFIPIVTGYDMVVLMTSFVAVESWRFD